MTLNVRCWLLACVLAAVPSAVAQQAQEPVEQPKDSVKQFAKSIVLDQKQIWTSPFHMTRQNARWWLLFGGVTAGLIATDRRSSQQLPNTKDQLAFARDVSQLGAIYTLVPMAGGMFLGGALTNQPKLRQTGLLGAEALVDGLIVSEVLKVATGRRRPLEGDQGAHFFHGGLGFPSGHTVGSFALASVVAHQYHDNKLVVVLAYGLATMVGASRFSALQHSASDIVAGGAIGWFIGSHVFDKHQEGLRSTVKSWLSPRVIPTVRPSDCRYGVMLAWQR